MQREPEVVFHNTPQNDAIEEDILQRIERLERFFDRIVGCRVVVDRPHQRHQQGNLHHVKIELAVPGHDIFVTREPHDEHERESLRYSIRDAFDIAERKLKEHVEKMRGDVKEHDRQEPPMGRVDKLFPDGEYGFIVGADGTELYFHKRAVQDDAYDELEIGTRVTYVQSVGEMGPRATVVRKMAPDEEVVSDD